jgi:hypothetical protein
MVSILSVAAIVLSLLAPVVAIGAVLSAYGQPSTLEVIGLCMPPVALTLAIVALLMVNRHRTGSRGRRKLTTVATVVSVAGILLEFTAVVPATQGLRSYACSQNLENLTLALAMYAGDNGVFPPSDSWCDRLFPDYVKNDMAFVCPERKHLRCGYAYNEALSEVNPETIKTPPHKTIIIFESDAGWNAAGGRELLVEKPRHRGGDWYGYAGGQMNSLTPMHEWHRRADVVAGKAGIFWDPMVEER